MSRTTKFHLLLNLMLMMILVPTVAWASVMRFGWSNAIRSAKSTTVDHVYIVKPGDTLWKLSGELHVPLALLISENHSVDPRLLQIGQKLHYRTPVSTQPLTSRSSSMAAVENVASALHTRPAAVRVLYCTLTAYTAGYESTGKRPGDPYYDITSTGRRALQGLTVAVDPRIIPYGSLLYIPGIGYRVAEDTGGAVRGTHIDVFYDQLMTALQFGVKHDIPVYVYPNTSPA